MPVWRVSGGPLLKLSGGALAADAVMGGGGGGGGGVDGDFVVVVIDDLIVATSSDGELRSSGTFTIPTAGTYTVTIAGLAGSERAITIDNGSVSKTGDSSPFTVDSGGVVGDLTIVAGADNATVTVA